MAFKTSADIQNGEYGRWEYDPNAKTSKFVSLGKAATIESITENIETGQVRLRLRFDYLGEKKYHEISRKSMSDPSLLQELIDLGADVTKKHFNTFVDTLRLQELDIEATGQGSSKVYEHLGWKTVPVVTPAGVVRKLCYRAATMIGPCQATYTGPLKVTPMGTFAAWKTMMESEIIGHIPAEMVMLVSLSALVNGLISSQTTGENPIVHLNGASSTGKSALAMAGVSAYGEPFDGERRVYDANGQPNKQMSCYGSWSATENATLGRCAGNQGCLIVLNELGKYKGGDMSSVCYNLSEGTDKARMTKDLEVRQMEGYHTTILSVGEQSLLERCQNKADGLRVRVLEVDEVLTKSAESADRIKAAARKNNGHAAPMMAEYIITNGGVKMALDIYDRWREDLLAVWPDTPFKERFVSKFPALLLTTAELAEQALGLTFSKEAIVEWFIDREKARGKERHSAAESYEVLLDEFRIHSANFWKGSVSPGYECWGKVVTYSQRHGDGPALVEEYLVRRNIVDKLLEGHGFANKKTCIEAWKAAGVLSHDADRPTRSRQIEPGGSKEDVYVFRVFEEPPQATYSQLAAGGGDVA